MKNSALIIDHLNLLLENELTAADQYFVHSRMYENWGLNKLYTRIAHEQHDELGHADVLIRRILFLNGVPDVAKRAPLKIGQNVPDMLRNDLAVEYEVAALLRNAIECCEKERDYVTRDLLMPLLEDTEHDHAHWLEQQLWLIDHTGLENYLQSMQ